MTAWAVLIKKVPDRNTVWCFPYNIWPNVPPYPGFSVLEQYLDKHYDVCYERLYNGGSPVLAVTFNREEDAFFFVISAQQEKTND